MVASAIGRVVDQPRQVGRAPIGVGQVVVRVLQRVVEVDHDELLAPVAHRGGELLQRIVGHRVEHEAVLLALHLQAVFIGRDVEDALAAVIRPQHVLAVVQRQVLEIAEDVAGGVAALAAQELAPRPIGDHAHGQEGRSAQLVARLQLDGFLVGEAGASRRDDGEEDQQHRPDRWTQPRLEEGHQQSAQHQDAADVQDVRGVEGHGGGEQHGERGPLQPRQPLPEH